MYVVLKIDIWTNDACDGQQTYTHRERAYLLLYDSFDSQLMHELINNLNRCIAFTQKQNCQGKHMTFIIQFCIAENNSMPK